MSVLGRTLSGKVLGAIVVSIVLASLLPVMTKSPDRTVTLVTKGMAFYLEGDFDHPNPTLRFSAGETIRLVLRNEDRGITHNLVLPMVDAATGLIGWKEEDTLTFEVPDRPGTYVYQCSPHMLMMKGILRVGG